MTRPFVRNDSQIERVSNAAICEEIGDRLRMSLASEPGRLPEHMMMLIDQMAAEQPLMPRIVQTTEETQ
jgi:hypothetical protein